MSRTDRLNSITAWLGGSANGNTRENAIKEHKRAHLNNSFIRTVQHKIRSLFQSGCVHRLGFGFSVSIVALSCSVAGHAKGKALIVSLCGGS